MHRQLDDRRGDVEDRDRATLEQIDRRLDDAVVVPVVRGVNAYEAHSVRRAHCLHIGAVIRRLAVRRHGKRHAEAMEMLLHRRHHLVVRREEDDHDVTSRVVGEDDGVVDDDGLGEVV
jgi:hypothetical protein